MIPNKVKIDQIPKEKLFELVRENKKLKLIKSVLENSLNRKTHGKMFSIVTGTWNPISGCLYNCNYCWAKNLALTKLKNTNRYAKGFTPSLNENEFKVNFAKGDLIFVADMSDMFADFIKADWIKQVFDRIIKFPETNFLFMTKNPKRYLDFYRYIPNNAILGATIETTKDEIIQLDKVSSAPAPSKRYEAMKELDWEGKIVSIEPILDFELNTFVKWIEDIDPFLVYVGYDNYCHKLREPTLKQTTELMQNLSATSLVIRKTIRPAWFEDNQLIKGKKDGFKT